MKKLVNIIIIICICLIVYPGSFYSYWFLRSIVDPMGAIKIENQMRELSSDVLIKKMNSIDPFSPYPNMSMSILGDRQERKAAPYLIKKLSYWNKYQRYAAIRALGEIGDESAIPALINIVTKREYKKDYEYELALEALSEMKSKEAFPYVIKLAKEHNGASIYMLKEYAQPETLPLLEAMRKDKTGEPTVDELHQNAINEAIAYIKKVNNLK